MELHGVPYALCIETNNEKKVKKKILTTYSNCFEHVAPNKNSIYIFDLSAYQTILTKLQLNNTKYFRRYLGENTEVYEVKQFLQLC